MAARLMPQEAIAAIIGISDDTLRKYYGEELRQGDAEGCLKISRSLHKLLEAGSEKAILHLAKVELALLRQFHSSLCRTMISRHLGHRSRTAPAS